MQRLPTSSRCEHQPFRLGPWIIDPQAREIADGTTVRRLSPKAMTVLQHLVAADGQVVSRDDLMDAAWPEVTVGEESLTHVISELRRAFGDPRNDPRLIKTVHKAGYRLLVQPVSGADDPVDKARDTMPADGFDLDAYLLCLEARRVGERSGPGAVEWAQELCGEAVARAPAFAFAQAEFAVAAVQRRLYSDQAGPSLDAAAEAAATATRLRPDQADGHAALGYALSALGRHGDSSRCFLAALARDPNSFEGHYLFARALFSAGEMTAAAQLAERAAVLAPDDYRALYLASGAWARVGDVGRAHVAASRGYARVDRRLEEDPSEPRARNVRGSFLARLGRFDEAIAAVEEDERSGQPLQYYNVAALAWAGAAAEAIARLEAITECGWRHADWLLSDPALSALRREQRFRKLESLVAVA